MSMKFCFHFKSLLYLYYSVGMALQFAYSDINFFMVEICKKCSASKNEPVIVIGNRPDEQLKSFQMIVQPSSIALLNFENTDRLIKYTTKKLRSSSHIDIFVKKFPARKFILNELEVSSLKLSLYKLRNSTWWNLYGYYFIRNILMPNACKDAYSVLKIIWELDILSAVFVCNDSNYGIQFYTFNPFTTYAPDSWKLVQIFKENNDHPFSLFKLMITDDGIKSICDALNFDKTVSLGGYPIKMIGVIHSFQLSRDPSTSIFKVYGSERIVTNTVWTKLNASIKLTLYIDKDVDLLYFNKSFEDFIDVVLNGEFDYMMNFRSDMKLWKNQYYLYHQVSVCCATSKKLLTPQEILCKEVTINKYSLMLIFAHIIALIIFMYLSRMKFLQAVLDLLRLFLRANMLYKPQSTKNRFFIIFLILIFLIETSYLQSRTFSLISVPIYDKYIASDQHLIDHNKSVYIDRFIPKMSTDLKNRITVMNSTEKCLYKIKNNFDSACLLDCSWSKYFITESNKIHISKMEGYSKEYLVAFSRNNFSLHKRLSFIFQKLQENGLYNFIIDYNHFIFHKKNCDISDFQSITLNQVWFSFIILMYALLFSSVIFLMECLYASAN